MTTVLIWAGGAVIGLGLVVVIAGLRQAARAAEDERHALAGQLRDLVRAVSDLSRRTEGVARSVDGVAKSAPRELDVGALAADVASRIKASLATEGRPVDARAPRVEPVETLLAWWNRNRFSASEVRAALPGLRAELPGFAVNQVEMVRGLVGLAFSPALPGGFRETVILPEMSLMVGDLKTVFTAPPGTPDMCRIQRTSKPASIETQFHGESRTELVNYGLQKGLIEPGDVL